MAISHLERPNTYDRHDARASSPIYCHYMARWEPVPLWRQALAAVLRVRVPQAVIARMRRA